jgi:UDP-3-O-[3-hydroxymyristoyl] glucosamine N-acyltransferase LpxD
MNKKVNVQAILHCLTEAGIYYKFAGHSHMIIENIVSFDKFSKNTITFYKGHEQTVIDTLIKKEGLLVLRLDLNKIFSSNFANILLVEDPGLAVCVISKLFVKPIKIEVHKSAIISPNVLIDPSNYIGANVVISENVIIGRNNIIDENCVLRNCIIGDNTHIFPGVKIGSSGLGSHKDSDGVWHHFPHLGKVIIKNNCVIQDNTVIARGSLSDTVLEDGVVIGPLTWIGHNTKIKKNVLIGQSVSIAGSANIGEDSIIWSGACIRDGISVGASSVVAMGSVVLKDIQESKLFAGNPAVLLREI